MASLLRAEPGCSLAVDTIGSVVSGVVASIRSVVSSVVRGGISIRSVEVLGVGNRDQSQDGEESEQENAKWRLFEGNR